MGRVTKRRKQELEKNLISIADELLKMSKELGVSIHLDANYRREDDSTNLSLFIHYDNPEKLAHGITSRLSVQLQELKGSFIEEPTWYTEGKDEI